MDVHLRRPIVKFKSIGQQLSVIKKILSVNSLNLEKPLFYQKSEKKIYVLLKHCMLNSYTFASSRIKIRSFDSAIKKRKDLCIVHTQYSQEKIMLLSKNHQKTAF